MFGWSQNSDKISVLLQKQKYDQAIELLKKEIQNNPGNMFLKTQLANAWAKAGHLKSALELFSQIGEEFSKTGQFTKALSIFKQMERIYPNQLWIDEKIRTLVKAKSLAPAPTAQPDPVPEVVPTQSAAEADPARDHEGGIEISNLDGGFEIEISGGTLRTETPKTQDPLAESPLFKAFSDEEFQAFVLGLESKSFEPGEILFSEGQSGDSLMVLVSGQVRVYVRKPSGEQEQVRIMPEGSFIGEISLLTQKPRTATIVAMSYLEVLELDRAKLIDMSKYHPEIPNILKEAYFARANSAEEERARKA